MSDGNWYNNSVVAELGTLYVTIFSVILLSAKFTVILFGYVVVPVTLKVPNLFIVLPVMFLSVDSVGSTNVTKSPGLNERNIFGSNTIAIILS